MHTRFGKAAAWPAVAVSALVTALLAVRAFAAETPPHEARFEKEIQAYEAADKTNPPPLNAILFIGSSSVRRWTNLQRDFTGYEVFNRGFGGSHLADSVAFVERIVLPYKPRLVLIYAGDNDIAAGKSPEEVFADFKRFVQKVHARLPETKIGFISIKPCPARENYLDQVKEANRLVKDYAAANEQVLFIDVFTPMLTSDGRPRADLVVNDRLHPNQECYQLWASIIAPVLKANR